MKASTGIGIAIAVVAILGGATVEGTSLGTLINVPAIVIVLGGTLGATIAAVGLEPVRAMPALLRRAVRATASDRAGRAAELVGYAERARREGLLSLEEEVGRIEDRYCRKGMQLVVDGTEPATLRAVLEAETDAMAGRHEVGAGAFEKAGGFAPTIGIMGAVLGLMHALGYLDSPGMLGTAIASAFVATLLGVGLANVLLLPVGNRLQALSLDEQELQEMTMEGVLAIQAGENPRILAERLEAYVPPGLRDGAGDDGDEPPVSLSDERRRRAA
ncbi:flagellar motor protein [Patulibacter defluvii]|uniref:flagellar motor protein n=1 Tax=Patulibacter defluvii TaxID=3095358 RepID=UPI002A74C1A2|nr:flagellar motor protein [Patulibacter sp. DM4]